MEDENRDNELDDDGELLFEAVSNADEAAVRDLLQRGVNVNERSNTEPSHRLLPRGNSGYTALYIACCNSNLVLAELLIANGADVHARRDNGLTPFHAACSCSRGQGHDWEVPRLLLENGADVNAKDNDGKTQLHSSCTRRRHDLEVVKFLIQNAGADTNARENNGKTPMHRACEHGIACEAINLLVANGANLNARDNRGWTPLHVASDLGLIKVVVMLLLKEHGADLHAKDNNGQTALYLTCKRGFHDSGLPSLERLFLQPYGFFHLEVARFLVENGAQVNAANHDGETALHFACRHGHLRVVQFLMSRGGNLSAKTPTTAAGGGKTPLHLACEGNHANIVWFLVRHQSHEVVPLHR